MKKPLFPSFGVLLVDDEPFWLRSFGMLLEGRGGISNLHKCSDSRQVMEILAGGSIGLVLLDLTMPHLSGEELLQKIVQEHPAVAVIIVSGLNQIDTAVRCMRLGAFDYFVKTTEEDRLLQGALRAIRMQEMQFEHREMRTRFLYDKLDHPEAFAEIITDDKSMRSIFQYIESVARSPQPVLITGESGVGKELVARAVHKLSGSEGALVTVNVAGLDDNHFSDTLFGHLRGAFTGADKIRKGLVEEAAGGTLFLDEIGDLSLASQVKLLRLLQEGEYFPIGSDKAKRSRTRFVIATHQDLAEKQSTGLFRKDLYYRLRSHHVHIPPLRKRRDDIPLLLDYFLEEAAEAMEKKKPTPPRELAILLSNYAFPGNVRELKAMAYDAVSFHKTKILSMETFKKAIGENEMFEVSPTGEEELFAHLETLPTLGAATDSLIATALKRARGNQTIAAKMLGISQPALSRRLKQRED